MSVQSDNKETIRQFMERAFNQGDLDAVYEELVIHSGWSADQYERWLAKLLKEQLLGHND